MKNKNIIYAFIVVSAIAVGYFAFFNQRGYTTSSTIPQPDLAKTELKDLPVAPQSQRVDLKMPTFSNPTNITNLLFPVKMSQVLLAGHIDGEPQQVTYSLLPGTRKIKWNGKEIETLVIQYNAYLDRRIIESATDWYAQADDGSVWYFGEDVFNYIDGEIVDTHGTWLTGRDGPPALIMPAHPKAGDVFRVENIPGIAFEEITVKEINATIDGAFGPISGVMVAKQLHMDGTYSDKAFAPNIGEYVTATPSDLEVVALALPVDALNTPVPNELTGITQGALAIYEAAGNENWSAALTKLSEMNSSWKSLKAKGNLSKKQVAQMDRALMKLAGDALAPAVNEKDVTGARLNAVDTALASLDMELRYRTLDSVDNDRLRVWARKAIVDAEAKEPGFLMTNVIALEMVEQRLATFLGSKDATVKSIIKDLRTATDNKDFDKAVEIANKLVNI